MFTAPRALQRPRNGSLFVLTVPIFNRPNSIKKLPEKHIVLVDDRYIYRPMCTSLNFDSDGLGDS